MVAAYKAIVIGASAGGLQALTEIIPKLPNPFIAVIVVLHLKADSENYAVLHLRQKSKLQVSEAKDNQVIEEGGVYIAPAGYHLLIEPDYTFSLSLEEPVHFSRPSIDVLFESAALSYGPHLIGVILTGANSDGSQGLVKIKQRGGLLLVQDPNTAYATEMPRSAIVANAVDYVVPLDKIADKLIELVGMDA